MNNRIRIARGENILGNTSEIVAGQPVYDTQKNILRVGSGKENEKTIVTTKPLNLEEEARLGQSWPNYIFNDSNITGDKAFEERINFTCPSLVSTTFIAIKYEIAENKISYKKSGETSFTQVYSSTDGWVNSKYKGLWFYGNGEDSLPIIPTTLQSFLNTNAQNIGTRVINDIFEEHSNYVKNTTKAENATKAETITLSQATPASEIPEGQVAICITDSIPTNPSPNVLYITTL